MAIFYGIGFPTASRSESAAKGDERDRASEMQANVGGAKRSTGQDSQSSAYIGRVAPLSKRKTCGASGFSVDPATGGESLPVANLSPTRRAC